MPNIRRIDAVIRQESFHVVKKALDRIDCPGMMVFLMKGHGKQKGIKIGTGGRKLNIELLPKMLLTIFSAKDKADQVIEAIRISANTGKIGDGKIFVSNVSRVIRVRTGEEDLKAI